MHSFEVHVWYPNILAPCTYLHDCLFILRSNAYKSLELQIASDINACVNQMHLVSSSCFNAMLCSLVDEYLHFEGTCYLILHVNSKNIQCVHWISNIIIQYWNMIYCVCPTSSVATDSTSFSWEWVNKFTFWVTVPKNGFFLNFIYG